MTIVEGVTIYKNWHEDQFQKPELVKIMEDCSEVYKDLFHLILESVADYQTFVYNIENRTF